MNEVYFDSLDRNLPTHIINFLNYRDDFELDYPEFTSFSENRF